MADVVEIGLAFWLLLAPGENWTWVIVGGHEMQHACEQARNDRLDGDYLVCASTPAWTAARPASADKPAGPCFKLNSVARKVGSQFRMAQPGVAGSVK